MFNRDIANKIDDLIKEKFPLIYEYDFDGLVLTWGGSIRNTIMNTPVKDLDFVILTQSECQIKDFIKKFKLDFFMNLGGGYKILYNGFTIDMRSTNDLLNATIYDADMLFYDINIHQFIICGILKAISNKEMKQINFSNPPLKKDKIRYKKIANFIKYVSGSENVKIKHNKFLWHRKMFVKCIRENINKIFNGNYIKCLKYIQGCKLDCCLWVLLKIFLVIISVLCPFVFAKILINIFNKNNDLITLCVFFSLKLISFIFMYFISKLEIKICKKMEYSINSNISNCVLNFSFIKEDSFLGLVKNDPKRVVKKTIDISNLLVDNLSVILILTIVLLLNYKIGIILFIFLLLALIIKFKFIKQKRHNRNKNIYDFNNCTGTYGNMVYNSVSNVKETKMYVKDNNDVIIKLIQYISFCIIIFLGIVLINKKMLTVSSLLIISIYSLLPFSYIINLGKIMDLVTELNVFCYRLFNLIDGNLYINKIFGKKYSYKCNGIIEFQNVFFKDNNENILSDCSFKIRGNKIYSLIGEDKKTSIILELISRLYNVDDGVVKIDGVDITEYSEEYIRENIATVSQNPYLLDMSIKDNLRLVKNDITDKEIRDVCKKVCLDEFIENLPNKYDTVIGDDGIELSGLERQKLGIARALIKKVKIILLDDCNYDDNESYEIMRKIINNIKKNNTIIISSKNDKFLKNYDNILFI